jgi:hypothetical protein
LKTKLKYPLIAKVEIEKWLESEYPYKNGDRVVLLGEISNMPSHVILADKEGKILWGYHLSDFVILTQEET